MWDKLSELEERFQELTEKLGDPEVVTSPERLKKVGQEHAELREVVACFQEYKKVSHEIEITRELVHGNDPELSELAAEEVPGLEEKQSELEERIRSLMVSTDPLDKKNAILEVRAGTGGEEAALFARELFQMYARYAERMEWRLETLSSSPTDQGGFKEVIALVKGPEVYGTLRYESGVHRVQRVPKTESQGRIHTSAVTVAVLPEAEELDFHIDEADLKVDVYRASGAGGQHVNTTDSAVRLTHRPTGLVVVCQDERSQHKNKSKAMKILRSRLLDMETKKREQETAAMRKEMVGSGDRSEKIRTYNFPQGRVTDHRIGLTLHKLDRVMEGELDQVVQALVSHFSAGRMKGVEEEGPGASAAGG